MVVAFFFSITHGCCCLLSRASNPRPGGPTHLDQAQYSTSIGTLKFPPARLIRVGIWKHRYQPTASTVWQHYFFLLVDREIHRIPKLVDVSSPPKEISKPSYDGPPRQTLCTGPLPPPDDSPPIGRRLLHRRISLSSPLDF
jgi:hypothetical protein